MSRSRLTRRGLLGAGAAAAGLATPALFPGAAWSAGYTNAPGPAGVTLGLTVPRTGPYADEGADELRAYLLAIEHLNGEGDGGMLDTFSSRALDGTGILGRKVGHVVGDTRSEGAAARAAARALIETEGAILITGGSSSSAAVAMQALCQEAGVIFMAGLTHSNDTTGKERRANGFRHFFNSYMSGAALAPVLAATYGTDRRAYYLTSEYNWGYTTETAISEATEALGWETVDMVRTPVGREDFTAYLLPVLSSGADTLVLVHYGNDLVNSLTHAARYGLRDLEANGKSFEIVVPLFSRLMAQGAGASIRGILGSANWHWSLPDAGSQAFVKSFGLRYGMPPSQAAHTCYVQTLLYADAVTRAGSFRPCAVAEALEGFAFDGLGGGPTLYRAEDHQCFKDVLVVRGKENPTSEFDLLEIVEITPVDRVTYPPDHPQFAGGALGACNDGA